MPGFTHLQLAQPVTFGHHLLAYVEMFARDRERMADCRRRVNRLPLGAAALAGTATPIDREAGRARRWASTACCGNSLDAVSDRDFAIEFCAAAALVMTHCRACPRSWCCGSSPRVRLHRPGRPVLHRRSIMPQKKNPDVPELARGKTGRVTGRLVALLTLMKGQPLAYNKDNQEDKEPLFDTVDTVEQTPAHLRRPGRRHPGQRRPHARGARPRGFPPRRTWRTPVRKGLPFRDAHEAVARAVRHAAGRGRDLSELTLDELRQFSPRVGEDVFAVLTLEGSVAARSHVGGTAPAQVRAAIGAARSRLGPAPAG